MRRRIIAGNWKMNMTKAQAKEFMGEFLPLCANAKCETVLCVPFTDIHRVYKLALGSNVKVGAQNVAWADKGAFTGEISAEMLKEVGAEYVIIGHSERRAYFGETDETVNMRLKQALKCGLKPIFCVGETLEQREGGLTEQVLKAQIEKGLDGVAEDVIIAYEPVWAIGTGKTATPEMANETIGFIRSVATKLVGEVSILYGGSMNAANAQNLLDMSEIDGGLIGGASLKPSDFSVIVNCD
ncbi:MAG: triose-phosphate isomerase [Clostridia bacterium]|nr:triose-phosphate isomerase [Clostridia bacterium]